MHPDELKAQLKAKKEQCLGIGGAVPQRPTYGEDFQTMRPDPQTLRGEAELRVSHHRNESEKAEQAARFFCQNPAFDEFVRLVRQGVIQF